MPADPPVILMVDDEPDILDSMRDLLETTHPDIRVETASSGEEALAILRETSVDLILTDYRMPNMSGIDLLVQAAALQPDATRIMITAYPDPALAARAAKDAGIALMISKPFDLEYFMNLVTSILSQRDGG